MDLGFYLAAICCVLISALQADTASKTEGNRAGGIGIKGYIGYIVIGIALAFLAAISKVVALIIVFAIGILAIMNKEGVHRSYSWVALLVLNGAMMLMAIARGWDKTGPKFSELKLLLFPLFFIVIAITVGRHREVSATS